MRSRDAVVLAGLLVSSVAAAQPAAGPFDGNWTVDLACDTGSDGALPYKFRFPATVKNSMLHGEQGRAGEEGYLTLDGPISANGQAMFTAHGNTGNPSRVIGALPRRTSYMYHVDGRFTATQGQGDRVEIRTCKLVFTKS